MEPSQNFIQNRPEVKEIPSVKRLEVVEFLDDAKITPTSSKYKPKFLEYLCEKMSMKINDVPKRIYSDIYKIIQFYRKSHSQIKTMINQHKIFFDGDLKPICLNSKNMDPDLSEVEFLKSTLRVFNHHLNSIVVVIDLESGALVFLIALVLSGAVSALCRQVQL